MPLHFTSHGARRLLRRFYLNSAWARWGSQKATQGALLYARTFPTSRIHPLGVVHPELHVVTGLPPRAFPRGGVCIGSVFLSGPTPSARVLQHEAAHARQWKRYGLLFPLFYVFAGANPATNRFELEAGLALGGYPTDPTQWRMRESRSGIGRLKQMIKVGR